ncbi:MAG: DUF6261 family protein [Tannerellaceae bacterium]|jgi:hypothetical protein|nr:DUF6261 family protein [Tannerellaceae bacterium]
MKQIIFHPSLTRRLRNAEHFDFFEIIDHHILPLTLKPAAIVPSWDNFHNAFLREDAIYKRFLRKENTRSINDSHKGRKKSYRALNLILEAGTYSNTPNVQTAAETLVRVMKNYPYINRSPMTEASAMIFNLIQDLKSAKYSPLVTLVGADTAVDRLRQDNDNFMALYADRAYEEEEEKDEGTLSEARKSVDIEFANLADALNVFYRTNEMQTQKDPEVSLLLSGIIRFVNSYIHQYETIYSRRNPKYTPGKDKPSDNEETPEENVPDIPVLEISAQEILGESVSIPNCGTQMSLLAADAEAFALALYPVARNGILQITNPGNAELVENYPVADFLCDAEGAPIGLIVNAPDSYTFFVKPFPDSDLAPAAVYKGEDLAAVLTGVKYPYTMSEG